MRDQGRTPTTLWPILQRDAVSLYTLSVCAMIVYLGLMILSGNLSKVLIFSKFSE